MEKKTFTVGGMGCPMCSAKIEKALSETGGVAKAEVSLESKQATVEFDPTKVSVADLIKVVTDLGYSMS